MSKQQYKFYNFKCQECSEEFNKGMWTKDGEQDGVNCPSCDVKVFYEAPPEVLERIGKRRFHLIIKNGWKQHLPNDTHLTQT